MIWVKWRAVKILFGSRTLFTGQVPDDAESPQGVGIELVDRPPLKRRRLQRLERDAIYFELPTAMPADRRHGASRLPLRPGDGAAFRRRRCGDGVSVVSR
jgi:hypothetical protein